MSAAEDGSFTSDFRPGSSTSCKTLLDIATSEIFRLNAFRLTGLPVDAKMREITKRAEKLEIMGEVGCSFQTGALALDTAPTIDQIREAMQRLKDPEQRIIDELFWFWPRQFGRSEYDPAIKALEGGDADSAFDIWTTLETNPSDGHVAMHNIAVLRHLMAIEWENHYAKGGGFTEESRRKIDDFWRAAFKRWKVLCQDDVFWETVSARVKQLDDPRLASGFVRKIRDTLPSALAKLNAEMALRYAEGGKWDLARIHVRFMHELLPGGAGIAKTAELVLAPTTARFRLQLQQAKTRSAKNPAEGVEASLELLNCVDRSFPLFELFYGKESELRKELSDEVAALCNRMQVAAHKLTHDEKGCLALLKSLLKLGLSADIQKQIESNLKVLAGLLSPKLLQTLLGALRGIDASSALPQTKLARVKKEILLPLDELIRDEGVESRGAGLFSNIVAVSLRDIFLATRRIHEEKHTATEAMTLACKLARTPELKEQLASDQAKMKQGRDYEVKKRMAQDEAAIARQKSGQGTKKKIPSQQPTQKQRSEPLQKVHAILQSIRQSSEQPNVRLDRFKSEAVPVITKLFSDSEEDSEELAALSDASSIVLRGISSAAWDLTKAAAQNLHGDIKTAVEANELATKYTLETDMRRRLAAERVSLLKLAEGIKKYGHPASSSRGKGSAEAKKGGDTAGRAGGGEPVGGSPGTDEEAQTESSGPRSIWQHPTMRWGLVMIGLIVVLACIHLSSSKKGYAIPVSADALPSIGVDSVDAQLSAQRTPSAPINIEIPYPTAKLPPAVAPQTVSQLTGQRATLASPPPLPSGNAGTASAPGFSVSELAGEKSAIDKARAKVTDLERQLIREKAELDAATRGAAQLQKQTVDLFSRVKQARASLDQTNQSVVDEYHRLADVYGSMVKNLQTQNEAVKRMTTRYNAQLDEARSEDLALKRMMDDYDFKQGRVGNPTP